MAPPDCCWQRQLLLLLHLLLLLPLLPLLVGVD
jgi:hypothetical protein